MPPITTESPTVAVVTVSYDSGGVLPAFLDSVAEASQQPTLVVVVDNDSPDVQGVRSAVAATGALMIEAGDNLGYGRAMNLGVASVPKDVPWILLSNPDVVLHEHALDELLAGADQRPHAASIGPRVLRPDGSVYPSARRLPSLRTGIGHALFAKAIPANPWTRLYQADELPVDEPRAAGWLSGSCLLIRRSAFDRVGGFDSGYFMYFEDVDLGARLADAGYENVYWPAAIATHSGAHSTAARAAQMERAHHASAARYVSRKYAAWYLFPIRAVLRVGLAARAFVLSRR